MALTDDSNMVMPVAPMYNGGDTAGTAYSAVTDGG